MQAALQNGASRVLNHRQPGYLDELKASNTLSSSNSLNLAKLMISD